MGLSIWVLLFWFCLIFGLCCFKYHRPESLQWWFCTMWNVLWSSIQGTPFFVISLTLKPWFARMLSTLYFSRLQWKCQVFWHFFCTFFRSSISWVCNLLSHWSKTEDCSTLWKRCSTTELWAYLMLSPNCKTLIDFGIQHFAVESWIFILLETKNMQQQLCNQHEHIFVVHKKQSFVDRTLWCFPTIVDKNSLYKFL